MTQDSKTDEPKAEVVKASASDRTKIVHRTKGGLFARKPKPPSAAKVMQATAAKLTAPLDETGRTHYEEVLDAQLEIAKDTSIERGTAATKAAEFVSKAAGFFNKPEDHKPSFTVILNDFREVQNGGALEDREKAKPLKPSFADTPYLVGEVVSTNEPSKPSHTPCNRRQEGRGCKRAQQPEYIAKNGQETH
jgi:hypothetical protein